MMRQNVIQTYGEEFAGLGNGTMVEQCHDALRLLYNDEAHYTRLVNDFLLHCVSENSLLRRLKEWHPCLVWGQLRDSLPDLANALVKVYKSPASSAGVERNHKIAKRIFTSRRGRTGELKIENQVAVSHNFCMLKKNFRQLREEGFQKHIANSLQQSSGVESNRDFHGHDTPSALEGSTEDDSEPDEEELVLESLLNHVMSISDIGDTGILNDPDWQ
ncbi:hypothetical protein FGB62_37g06 [Gracilaria domingensis]|nr:hypothetical protein FGB62_37g06 [Gracilaria domingensis]